MRTQSSQSSRRDSAHAMKSCFCMDASEFWGVSDSPWGGPRRGAGWRPGPPESIGGEGPGWRRGVGRNAEIGVAPVWATLVEGLCRMPSVTDFYPSSAALRAWLLEHHAQATDLWVGFHKKGSGGPGMTWEESVDLALCFGWIDGIRKRVDEFRRSEAHTSELQ